MIERLFAPVVQVLTCSLRRVGAFTPWLGIVALVAGIGLNAAAVAQQTPRTEGGTGEVQIELERFGTGNQARVGSWCGIRLKLTDSAPKQRELIVRLRSVDSDGDKPVSQVGLTSNPGLGQQIWLYTRLPHPLLANPSMLSVGVYEALETNSVGEPGTPGYRAGVLLASLTLTPKGGAVIEPTVGLIGVIGARGLGLQQYADRAGISNPWHKIANEVTEITTGITPEDVPDRWIGLSQFEAIVWADGDPAKLRGDRARAMRDYIMQGGHLIIVLPPVGQTWTNQSSNELHDIMPAVTVTTQEKVEFEGYRPLLTSSNSTSFPKTSTVQNFQPIDGTLASEAASILDGPDGKSVAIRREVGAGAVTFVGLDLNQTALSQFKMIDAEVFWHRILGRRGNLLEPEADPSTIGGSKLNLSATANRRDVRFDAGISYFIGKSGSSATGVLAGFIVFALYWAIAGPVGFAILKRRGLSHHAWPLFIGCSIVFTGFAWGGAWILRPKQIEATHLTILDHVYGQPTQRARMWASVLLPTYGTASIGVGDPADLREQSALRRSLNTIAPWESPSDTGIAFGGFPDARDYALDARTPDVIRVPTRQTVKQVEVQWAGGPRWEMPLPLAEEGKTGVGTLAINERAWLDQAMPLVSGSLVHKLPGPLTDITVIVVRRQSALPFPMRRSTTLPDRSPLICVAEAYRFADPWEPGTALSLDTVTRPRSGPERLRTEFGSYLDSLIPSSVLTGLVDKDETGFTNSAAALTAIGLFPLLPTPNHNSPSFTVSIPAPQRADTHCLDLGRWFTRPCVIIIGLVGQTRPLPTPIPFCVDGE
ncbi:MAG: hypothetical protein NTV94_10790, partial [Planctomycetota bacterium]|nr:hypothetical protein [Planctomycetota bacterium]